MALIFNGTSDVVAHGDIAAVDSAGNLSGCLWIKVKTGRTNNDPFIVKGIANLQFLFSLSGDVGDRVQFRDQASGGRSYTASSVTQDVWEWWGFVWNGGGSGDSNKVQMYKNGAQETLTHAATWGATTTIGDGGTAAVSVAGASGGQFLPCDVALIKLWSASLTAAEMAQEYQSYRPARTANLLLWAPYDDDTSAKDYSGSGNHGTVTGATLVSGPPVSYGDQ